MRSTRHVILLDDKIIIIIPRTTLPMHQQGVFEDPSPEIPDRNSSDTASPEDRVASPPPPPPPPRLREFYSRGRLSIDLFPPPGGRRTVKPRFRIIPTAQCAMILMTWRAGRTLETRVALMVAAENLLILESQIVGPCFLWGKPRISPARLER